VSEHLLGAGIDLVENCRLGEMLDKWGHRFKDRVFLRGEQEYCDSKACPRDHYAGRFAVKEAVTKAFGTGVGPSIGWLDIEVVSDPVSGAPSVRLSRRAKAYADSRGICRILVSLSHTRTHTVAHAILSAEDGHPGRAGS
jgi:holo-[acyl-carrier protein] synthase